MRFYTLIFAAVLLAGCRPEAGPETAANASRPSSQPTAAALPSATPATPKNDSPTPAVAVNPASSPAPAQKPDPNGIRAAADILQVYYAAINARDYRAAYDLWSGKGEASHQSFEQFRDGFANTRWVTAELETDHGTIEGAAGSQYATVPVTLVARQSDGRTQRFSGEYVLRRSMVDGATAEQQAWRIYSANIVAEK